MRAPTLARRGRRATGAADRPPARPVGHPAQRGAGLARARQRGLPADRLRRPRPRRVRPRRRATSTRTWWPTSRPCSTTSSSSAPCWSGSSMGAATAMAFALEHPERVPALVQITPAYTGYARTGDATGRPGTARRRRSSGRHRRVRRGRPAGTTCPSAGARSRARPRASGWSATSDLEAVAEALREVPRSIAWKGLEPLAELECRSLVVGSPRRVPTRCTRSAWPRSTPRRLPSARAGGRGRRASRRSPGRARSSRALIADFLERVGYS